MHFTATLARGTDAEQEIPVAVEATLTPERRFKLRVIDRSTGAEVEPTDNEFDHLCELARQ